MMELTEDNYKTKVKELEKDLKKYRIMNNQKNIENKQLKEELEIIRSVGKFYLKKTDTLKQKLEKIKEILPQLQSGLDADVDGGFITEIEFKKTSSILKEMLGDKK